MEKSIERERAKQGLQVPHEDRLQPSYWEESPFLPLSLSFPICMNWYQPHRVSVKIKVLSKHLTKC